MKNKDKNLVPRGTAAEEFGVDRQTITNWYNEGLLQGTHIKNKLFILELFSMLGNELISVSF